MDAETLERLLMDRALGGLAPDVDALLDAYLAQDPSAAERAREFTAAAAAARAVLGAHGREALPPFPGPRLAALEAARRRLRIVRNVTSLAAVLIIGIGLGIGLARDARRAPRPDTRPARLVLATVERPMRNTSMWSKQRLIERARRTHSDADLKLIWESAVDRPHLGGAS